jgi:hypothetical protein
MRKAGLPEIELGPGERMLWDNRFRIELGAEESAPITVRALGEEGLKVLKEREALPPSLPRPAARALPGCWRGGRLLCLPDFDQKPRQSAPSSRHEVGLDCRATFLWGAL